MAVAASSPLPPGLISATPRPTLGAGPTREGGMVDRLTGTQRQAALRKLHGWSEVEDRDAIRKSYHFSNFSEAWGFLSRIALAAEKMDHHPEIFNVYNRVEIILSTHDADGVSEKDVALAEAIDELAPERDRKPPTP
jgi:4a-hydroxytetrahydrobiopterin dehydratase